VHHVPFECSDLTYPFPLVTVVPLSCGVEFELPNEPNAGVIAPYVPFGTL